MQAPPEHTGSVIYDLAEGSEWRFELDEEEAVAVRVSLGEILAVGCCLSLVGED